MSAGDLDSRVEVLATDVGFCEGPVVTTTGSVLCVSWDHGRLYEIVDGAATVRAELGVGANGATEAHDGQIFIAHSGGHAATVRPPFRFGMSGGVQVVDAQSDTRWVTMDPIRPNDLCFGPDGFLWVTDPHQSRRTDGRIWRIDPETGVGELLTTVPWYTNGIGFGPRNDLVYVADTYGARIMAFPIDGDTLGDPEPVIQLKNNHPDGFAFDAEGNVVIAAVSLSDDNGDIQVWNLSGNLLDRFSPGVGTHFTNVALDADATLIVCDSSNGRMLAVPGWPAAGLGLHPHRNTGTVPVPVQ